MFKPEEIIFAPTSKCNLACAHCRVKRVRDELSAEEAITFLKACRGRGIERVGFSGGEPFLRPDFLDAVSAAAVKEGLLFDRLMTNGVWYKKRVQLRTTLSSLRKAGFDGTFGISIDAYHIQDAHKLAAFFRTVFSIWKRRDCCEIVSVTFAAETQTRKILKTLAGLLGGKLLLRDKKPFSIVDTALPKRRKKAFDDGSALRVNIVRVPYSASAEDGAWDAEAWFENDFCRGPGNVFYVHPDGSVSVCCGFANENPALKIGTIGDGFAKLMRRAATAPLVKACFETGLAAFRARLEARGRRFPGKTADPCFFCETCAKTDGILPKKTGFRDRKAKKDGHV
jgi:uncharacterized Fe-S cluster-containing radical SAM superfamily protein